MNQWFTAEDYDNRRPIISESQARDPKTYRRLDAEARSRGMELEIVSDAEYHQRLGREMPTTAPLERDEQLVVTLEDGRQIVGIYESECADFTTFRRFRDQADKLNLSLEIIPDPPDDAPPDAAARANSRT